MTIDSNALTAVLESFLDNLVAPLVERAVNTHVNHLNRRIDLVVTQMNDLLGGVGQRIEYGETRLNEAREAIRELQGKVVELTQESNRARSFETDLDLNDHIDTRIRDHLDSDLGASQIADAFEQGRLKRKIEAMFDEKFGEQSYMTYEDVRSKIDSELDDFCSSDALSDAVTDMIRDKLDGARINLQF